MIAKLPFRLLYLAFGFSTEICLRPGAWIVSMAIRFGLAYEFSMHSQQMIDYFTPIQEIGFKSILFNLSICLPLMLFILWWCFTSILMFLSALYSRFGYRNFQEESEYSEFKKIADYTNNKMRFQSYKSSMDFLRGKDS